MMQTKKHNPSFTDCQGLVIGNSKPRLSFPVMLSDLSTVFETNYQGNVLTVNGAETSILTVYRCFDSIWVRATQTDRAISIYKVAQHDKGDKSGIHSHEGKNKIIE